MSTSVSNSQLTSPSEPEKFRNPLNWHRRTKFERTLCLITVTSVLMVAVMVIVLSIFVYRYQKNLDSKETIFSEATKQAISSNSSLTNLCLTSGCVKAAAFVLSNLNENVDPCTDFYRFACGGWLKRNILPEDKSYVSVFSEVRDNLNLKLKALLESELDVTEPSFIKMIKELYHTCMDVETLEKLDAEPLKKVLKQIGGWPVIEGRKWDETKFDWIETLISFRKLGYNHNILFELSVMEDVKNNTVHIISLDQTSLGMPDRSYLIRGLNDSVTAAYYNQMVNAAKNLGAQEASVENELLEALHFEINLANISLPREERRNTSQLYNKYTLKQLQRMVPQISWIKYFNGLLNNEVYENETLTVAVPEFLKNFAELITNTEKRVVANYMMWRVVSQSLSLLSKKWRDIAFEYDSVLTGKSEDTPRWELCFSDVSSMWIALGSYYVRHYFKEESKDAALELVNYVHQEFLHILDEIDWMDEKTKEHAKAKAIAMRTYIAYPKELLNNTAIIEHYRNLIITNESYFENVKRLQKWLTDDEFSNLRKPNIRGEWKKHATAAEVNAFYDPVDNSIELPAGVLQSPYFSKDRPHYMNFGGIGSIFGHEITHGFDDQGRQFDKDGNNRNWWDETTDALFTKRAQCIIDQYSNYTAENGMNLNGVNTQGENIADNGGLKQAYWAYQSWVKDNGPEQLLPGLKYTQNQIYWISVASGSCEKLRPQMLKDRIIAEDHSPEEFRVIGPMSNLQEFSKDFNCPPDSPMNKKHKCQIW